MNWLSLVLALVIRRTDRQVNCDIYVYVCVCACVNVFVFLLLNT